MCPENFLLPLPLYTALETVRGGYVFVSDALPTWDLWRLEDSIGLRKTNTPCSIDNVLRTFNLSCNAIALDIRTAIFVDAGAINAIHKNMKEGCVIEMLSKKIAKIRVQGV
jgi:hypothetical protein